MDIVTNLQDCKVIIWTKDENSGDSWASAVSAFL